jgi:hypothetical protein
MDGGPHLLSKFPSQSTSKAQLDANKKLLTNLEDLQTTLCLNSMCTANKITHLFANDVYNTALDELPEQHWLWNSDLTDKFSTTTADLIANITNQLTSQASPSTHNSFQTFLFKRAALESKVHAPTQSRHT